MTPWRAHGAVNRPGAVWRRWQRTSHGGAVELQAGQGPGDKGGGVPADLAEVAVAVDVLALVAVLQLVVFDVQPQGLHDGSPRLSVHPQQPRQAGVQLVLGGLGWTDGSQEGKTNQSRLGQGQEGFTIGTCPQPQTRVTVTPDVASGHVSPDDPE